MTRAPTLHRKLTLYFELAETVAQPAPGTAFRCSNEACEQHARQYDLVPFEICPSCYGSPEVFETGETVLAYPDLDDFLNDLDDDLDGLTPIAVSDLTGVPGNVWMYNRALDWLQDWCDGFDTEKAGLLNLYKLPVNSVITRAFMEDLDIETFMERFADKHGKNTIALRFGLVQYWV